MLEMTDRGPEIWKRGFRQLCRHARAGLLLASVSLGLGGAAEATTILLDDFEGGFDTMSGTISASSEILLTQKAGRQWGMGINQAGQGACDHLIGDSNAICGADTLKWAGDEGAVLSYLIDFGSISRILFDVAALSDADPFDLYSGENSAQWGDYLRVWSVIDGTRVLLAEFTGVATADRTPQTAYNLVSTSAGAVLAAGVIADATFGTVALGLEGLFDGWGEITFEIRSTGSAEQIGIDNIRVALVPLPGALSVAFAGFAGFAAARRTRRRQ